MKGTSTAIIMCALLIGGAIVLTRGKASVSSDTLSVNNVTIVDGKQIIEIKAKGGYVPTHSVAKAGIPTILRLDTNGTFDCSSSVRIPTMDISQNLPPSGTTDIDIGIPEIALLQGTCGMGMYPFEIEFQG